MEQQLAKSLIPDSAFRRDRLFPYLFLAPSIVLLLALTVYPLIYIVTISLHRVTPRGETFVGLANFARLFQDGFFFRSVWQTLLFTVGALALEMLLGLIG